MGFVEPLAGTVVGLDTTPLIYFIEKHEVYHPVVRPFFVALAAGKFTVVTSTITLVETLVHPIRTDHPEIAQRYREILLRAPQVTTYDVSPDIAQKAAEIRAIYQVRTPDAIQLATAFLGGATHFLTNDRALRKYTEIQILVVADLA